MVGNLLDRAIGYLSPARGAKRMVARAQIAAAQSGVNMIYESAARSHRTAFRRAGNTSANAEISMALPRLREVSRDFGRNNPYAANIHAAIPSSVVGYGIVPTVVSEAKRQKKELARLIAEHLETPAIDIDGRLNFYGLQNLAMRTVVESGEALIVRYSAPARLRLPVQLQIRVFDPDYLDTSKNGPVEGGVCFQGIEVDAAGRRVAYWLYDEHPGGGLTWRMPKSSRVPASDVIHLYRIDRPGQMRGVPWGASGHMTMWDLADYEEAELMRQKVAACFAVFWTGTEAGGLAQTVTGGATPAGIPLETIEPGMIQRLPSGADVKTATPPMMQGYRDFITVNARKVSCAYGVPYEIATGDMSQVSFISGRLGMLQFNRNVEQWRWHMLIPHMCAGVGGWFLADAALALGGPVRATLQWTAPRREMVSPKDEIPPIKEAIRSGLASRSEKLREAGYDPEQVDQEIAADNARADKLGLKFDSDGRVSAAGAGIASRPEQTKQDDQQSRGDSARPEDQ